MPKVEVYDSNSKQIGLIIQNYCPMIYCQYQIEIYHGTEASEFNLFRKIRRCAINCHSCCSVACCGICGKELEFEVTDSMGNSQETLKKIHNGYYNECCTAADRYEVRLPTSESDAALLLAAI